MAGLVGQGEYVLQYLRFVVHQDVRIAVERSATERPALFTTVRIAVAPAFREPLLQYGRVLVAQRRQSPDDHRHGLTPRAASRQSTQDRHVGVVVVNIPQPHLATSHVVVPVHGRQSAMDGFDQLVVHRLRHIVRVQCGGQRTFVVACASVVDVLLDRTAERGGQGVLVGLELLVVLSERRAPHAAFGRHQQ